MHAIGKENLGHLGLPIAKTCTMYKYEVGRGGVFTELYRGF
jgi:hypothetical protein